MSRKLLLENRHGELKMGLVAEVAFTGKQIKSAALEYHSTLQPTKKFYPDAGKDGQGEWRRYIEPSNDNVFLISEALYIEADCSLRTPDIIQSLQRKYKHAMIVDINVAPILTHNPGKHKKHLDKFGNKQAKLIKIQKRRNMANVMTYMLYRTDIKTRYVGSEGENGFFFGVMYSNIMQATKLSKDQVRDAVQTLIAQGILHTTQRKVRFKHEYVTVEDDGQEKTKVEWQYRSQSNVYQISEAFLNSFGMLKYWDGEAQKKIEAEERERQEQNRQAQEAASEREAKRRFNTSENTGNVIKFERQVKQIITNLETGEVKTFNVQDRRERQKEQKCQGYQDFKKIVDQLRR